MSQVSTQTAASGPAPFYATQHQEVSRHLRGAVRGYKIRAWAPSLIGWAGVAGFAALWILEATPIAKRDVFSQLPVIGGYWQNKLDEAERKD